MYDMKTINEAMQPAAPVKVADNHISVDCVVFGFDGETMRVLLVKRAGEEDGKVFHDMKLPGSLIYVDEDLDEAAKRVLHELTGLKNVRLKQFKAFGSKDRTKNVKDVHWLERAHQMKIDRIVTVGYVALVKITRNLTSKISGHEVCWVPASEVPDLAFDHNIIIRDAQDFLKTYGVMDISIMFDLLPKKFTASELRRLFLIFTGKEIDARNFYKKISSMPYVIPLSEKEEGVSHRAARFYRFDRNVYRKNRI